MLVLRVVEWATAYSDLEAIASCRVRYAALESRTVNQSHSLFSMERT
jgi:hypothetical protein